MSTISVVVPTYREESYIVNTINELAKQNVWHQVEVVIADFDPDKTQLTKRAIMNNCRPHLTHVQIVDVDKGGIGYARHKGIMAAHGEYIVCFDADCHFSDNRGLELLCTNLTEDVKVTHCASIIQPEDLNNVEAQKFNALYVARNLLLKVTKLPICFEQGLTMTKATYLRAGGFKDVKILEGPTLCTTIGMIWGMNSLMFVPDAVIMTSARRGMGSDGFLFDLNYDMAYRTNGAVKVT